MNSVGHGVRRDAVNGRMADLMKQPADNFEVITRAALPAKPLARLSDLYAAVKTLISAEAVKLPLRGRSATYLQRRAWAYAVHMDLKISCRKHGEYLYIARVA